MQGGASKGHRKMTEKEKRKGQCFMLEKRTDVGEARFSLIIRGQQLPFEELSRQLDKADARMVRQGDVLNQLPRIVAPEDEWVYTVALTNPEGEDAALNALLADMDARQAQLKQIAATCQVTMRLYIQSDRAQIAYRLMPETLKRLVSTGLPLDITSLSWGEIGI